MCKVQSDHTHHVQMLHTGSISFQPTRNDPIPRPSTPARLAMCFDVSLARPLIARQQFPALWVGAYSVGSAVEVGGLAVRGEDFEPEDGSYGASESHAE